MKTRLQLIQGLIDGTLTQEEKDFMEEFPHLFKKIHIEFKSEPIKIKPEKVRMIFNGRSSESENN